MQKIIKVMKLWRKKCTLSLSPFTEVLILFLLDPSLIPVLVHLLVIVSLTPFLFLVPLPRNSQLEEAATVPPVKHS
jgi:hypothetical protein